jgi:hypothetical protein
MVDFSKIAETRMMDAIKKGELENLPGAGKPLKLEDPSPFEDPDQRATNRLMKNLGLVPDVVQISKEIEALKMQITESDDEKIKTKLKKKLDETKIRYNTVMEMQMSRR